MIKVDDIDWDLMPFRLHAMQNSWDQKIRIDLRKYDFYMDECGYENGIQKTIMCSMYFLSQEIHRTATRIDIKYFQKNPFFTEMHCEMYNYILPDFLESSTSLRLFCKRIKEGSAYWCKKTPKKMVKEIFFIFCENDLEFFKFMLSRAIGVISLAGDAMHMWERNAWMQYAKMLVFSIQEYTGLCEIESVYFDVDLVASSKYNHHFFYTNGWMHNYTSFKIHRFVADQEFMLTYRERKAHIEHVLPIALF